jgi:hypothetical protein
MPIWGVTTIVGVIQIKICCREDPRDGFAAARPFILLAGQNFNFGLVSAVKHALKLLSKQNGWLELYTKANMGKLTSILGVDVHFVEASLKPIIQVRIASN